MFETCRFRSLHFHFCCLFIFAISVYLCCKIKKGLATHQAYSKDFYKFSYNINRIFLFKCYFQLRPTFSFITKSKKTLKLIFLEHYFKTRITCVPNPFHHFWFYSNCYRLMMHAKISGWIVVHDKRLNKPFHK